jgi:hypothetical protein
MTTLSLAAIRKDSAVHVSLSNLKPDKQRKLFSPDRGRVLETNPVSEKKLSAPQTQRRTWSFYSPGLSNLSTPLFFFFDVSMTPRPQLWITLPTQ